jgi:hypothetical protein
MTLMTLILQGLFGHMRPRPVQVVGSKDEAGNSDLIGVISVYQW